VNNYIRKCKIGFSLYGLLAFLLQELPYLPWLLCPPINNPLANNIPINTFFGIIEKIGGVLTVASLILVTRKLTIQKDFKNMYLIIAVVCLIAYYICWVLYFNGITNVLLIIIGLTAVVPIYYFFVAMWLKNYFAVIISILFFFGHTISNIINYS
jgi:predicted neutral ceramidase superfamily lipid hydrolase